MKTLYILVVLFSVAMLFLGFSLLEQDKLHRLNCEELMEYATYQSKRGGTEYHTHAVAHYVTDCMKF